MTDLQKQNQKILDDVKLNGPSYGMRLLIDAIAKTQRKRKHSRRLPIYMKHVTPKRLQAFVIHDGVLHRLCIPEAGFRLYADYNDGYQYMGGGYSFELALLERFRIEASRHINVTLSLQGGFAYERI
jgi:hypothetical protein